MATTASAANANVKTAAAQHPTAPVNDPSVTGVAIVVGEVHPVKITDLIRNTAVDYYIENPKSKPRWCLRKTAHDVDKCTFLHRTADKASNYVMVRGEPAPVSIGHLIQNKGLERILGTADAFGEWCDLASPHDIPTCKRLHLGTVANDRQVTVEGEEGPVNVSHLLLNRGVSYLLTFPEAKGVWCNNKIVHDVINCPYVHRRIDGHPKVVNVEEEKFPVPVSQLIPNKALAFLLDNPQCSGRWCGRVMKHEVEECSYLHRVHPFVRVDGESVRINTLKSNRGLKYLLEHPSAQGHWCRSAEHNDEHPLETCTFIHLKDESRQQRTAESAQRAAAAAAAAAAASSQQFGGGRGGNMMGPTRGGRAGGPFTGSARGGRAGGFVPPAAYNNNNVGQQRPVNTPSYTSAGGPIARPAGASTANTRPRRDPLPQRPAVGTVTVEGAPVDAASLINNPGLQYLLNHAGADGRSCTRISDPNHRADICHYIHRQ